METLEDTGFAGRKYPGAACVAIPAWHVRSQRVQWSHSAEACFLAKDMMLVDEELAIPASSGWGYCVPHLSSDHIASQEDDFSCARISAMITSPARAGGIVDMSSKEEVASHRQSHAFILEADANTNLVSPKTPIPCIAHYLTPASSSPGIWVRHFVSGVFAVAGSQFTPEAVYNLWKTRPAGIMI